MTDNVKILVVEDEEQLTRMLRSILTQSGYTVTSAKTGVAALELLLRGEFGVILLDLGLPDMDGKELISQARAISAAPILVISAREAEQEKIAALDLGASDYVAKPFDAGELLARIRVALRPPRAALPKISSPQKGLQIDITSRRATIDGKTVRLSRRETDLVQLLADANGGIVRHDAIIEAIWGRGSDADLMNVRVLAWQLRRKIEPDISAPRFLIAEMGEGYRLNLE